MAAAAPSAGRRFVCVHGHFYQPQRENPWTGRIDQQLSAAPFHDWNERITHECYEPNTRARVHDGHGRAVNNYARISFNFGPTLLSWMEEQAPDTYAAILAGDRESRERFSGHGSALAQAHGHIILPLANERDIRTQVRWGLRDFAHRFGRPAEGMWLPECAADTRTLQALADEGVRFTVLAPGQARRVHGEAGGWHDAAGGRIDPRRPYQVELAGGRSIAVFFYDGPISQAVAFEGLLHNGERLAARLMGAFSGERREPQLAHIATDGESYGHHHRFGEMALAYALDRIEQDKDTRLTNYGEFLERNPPARKAEIVENSSWSCAHGVERWRADCGCATGDNAGGSQAWRGPLRAALDELRDAAAGAFEKESQGFLWDCWRARDEYIGVLLDGSPDQVGGFLRRNAAVRLSDAQRSRVFKLLELQRFAQLMYTSCGWFFDDIGRIETLQVLRYAARVLELSRELFGEDWEPAFLRTLRQAKSNDPKNGDGAMIYRTSVRPSGA
ncbi:MAG: DUF3536 domain-containing protein [Elusimicrobiota bacterium]